jgi:outer membrane protein
MRFQRYSLNITFSLFLCAATLSASTDSISLKFCIKTALSNNQQLIVSKGNTESSLGGYESARSSLLPQVSLAGNAGEGGTDVAINNGTLSAGIQANLQIYDFGKTFSRIGSSERSWRASESDALSVRQNVLLSVCSAYYDCLAARAVKEVSLESLKLAETHRDQAKILLEAGKGIQFNVVTAEVDVEKNRLAVVQAENSVQTNRLTLANTLGIPLADTLLFRDSLSEALDFPSLEDARKASIETRPEIKSARLRVEAAQKSVVAAQCGRYPAITSSAGAGMQSPVRTIDWHENWNIGIGLSLPLYEGGAISAAIRQARGGLISAQGNLALAEQLVSLDVEQQYLSVKQAFASIDVAKKSVEQSSNALTMAQERYKVGSGSPLEISNAELDYSNAKISLVQALTNLNNAHAGLQRAMGTLTEDFAK